MGMTEERVADIAAAMDELAVALTRHVRGQLGLSRKSACVLARPEREGPTRVTALADPVVCCGDLGGPRGRCRRAA